MAVTLGKNPVILGVQRRVGYASEQFARSLERLGSGSRINRASDDAAGLAVSSQLQARSRIYSQGVRNLNDGVSYLNIASAALGEATAVTTRLQELAAQAANGTFSITQRRSLDQEADSLVAEFNRILSESKFNGVSIFSEENFNLILQAGFGSDGVMFLRNGIELARSRGIGTFSASTATSVLTATDLVSADINGDGYADAIQANGTNVVVRTGNGDGTFSVGGSTISMGAAPIGGIRLADMNGDGQLDIVARLTNSSISVSLNNGSGSFGAAANYMGLAASQDFTILDFNGDGQQDVATVTAGGVYVAMNNGSGGLSTASLVYARSHSGGRIIAGDIDGDGQEDLITVTAGANVSIFGNGAGGVRSAYVETTSFSSSPVTVAGDFNSDGRLDIAQYDAFSGSGLRIGLGNGQGSYSVNSQNTIGLSSSMTEMLAADFNGDGHLDLYTTGNAAASRVLMGKGDGTFTATATTTAGSSQIATADINGDGVLDIVSISGLSLIGRIQGTIQTGEMRYLDLNTRQGALSAMSFLEEALSRIAREQGRIGGHLARLSVGLQVLTDQSEGMLAAASRISDVDIAEETSNQIRFRLLQEAGAAVLAQANQSSAIALKLLQY